MKCPGLNNIHNGGNNCAILKGQRRMLGLTQKQVTERAKIGLQAYQKFEGGQRDIKNASFKTACKVIKALEMDIMEFCRDDY